MVQLELPPKDARFETILNFFEEFIDAFLETGVRPSVEEHVALYSLVHDLDRLHCCVPDFLRGASVPAHLLKYGGGASYMAMKMHDLLKTCFSRHLKSKYDSVVLDSITDESLLHIYGESWRIYIVRIKYLCRVLASLNHRFGKLGLESRSEFFDPRDYYPTVYNLAMIMWERLMLDPVEKRLHALGKMAQELHEYFKPDSLGMVKLVYESFLILRLFGKRWTVYGTFLHRGDAEEDYNVPFLRVANIYFKAAAKAHIAAHGLAAYLAYAPGMLAQEEERAKRVLRGDASLAALGTQLGPLGRRVLILGQATKIEALTREYLEEGDEEGLRRLYASMAGRLEVSAPMRGVLEAHMRVAGRQMVKDFVTSIGGDGLRNSKDPHGPAVQAYFDELETIHSALLARLRRVFGHVFGADTGIAGCVESAFCAVVTQNAFTGLSTTRGAELLAKQADALLRKGKDADRDEGGRRAALDQVIRLLRYTEQKDVFQFYYTKALCMRLMNGQSASEELENYMIHTLRTICGSEYANKLQRMFTDLALSEELTNEFKEQKWDLCTRGYDVNFSVKVLSTQAWPLSAPRPSDNFIVPPCILPTLCNFEQTYLQKKYTGRTLHWLWNYSTTEVHTTYTPRRHVLTTSAYQMAVLMLYNDCESLMPAQLVDATGLRWEILTQVLVPLLKARILVQDREGAPIDLNLDFGAKKTRINVSQVVKTEVEADAGQKELMKSLETERKYVLQATIVRIMKTHRKMENQKLIHEVTAQIAQRFVPKIPDIKAAIDALLEGEYIERDARERDTFVYAA